MGVPSGMGEYDTAAFADSVDKQKTLVRTRIRCLNILKQRIKSLCFNYATRIDIENKRQEKTENLIFSTYASVNNYFKTHCETVYTKLQSANDLAMSNDNESPSLLLTQVRRAMHATADYFYPPKDEEITCSDGVTRKLGPDQYLNRLQEFINSLKSSDSKKLIQVELDLLTSYLRKLNSLASKGVHTQVSQIEAQQGLLGLYLFLSNVISRITLSNE
ncbi:MAG: hypothetical protein AAGH99_07085 [Planctomycetota bacterium]